MKNFKCVRKGYGGKPCTVDIEASTISEAAYEFANKYCAYEISGFKVGDTEIVDIRVYTDEYLFLGTVSVEFELVMLSTVVNVKE